VHTWHMERAMLSLPRARSLLDGSHVQEHRGLVVGTSPFGALRGNDVFAALLRVSGLGRRLVV
jgi:hypothetical protein